MYSTLYDRKLNTLCMYLRCNLVMCMDIRCSPVSMSSTHEVVYVGKLNDFFRKNNKELQLCHKIALPTPETHSKGLPNRKNLRASTLACFHKQFVPNFEVSLSDKCGSSNS